MGFPAEVCDRVLVRCGRHCCICRRFNPTLLQVHHIQESSKGGDDSEENAIALCVSCHSDVHTYRPFTRRFTKEELIGHRNRVYEMVGVGSLRAEDGKAADALELKLVPSRVCMESLTLEAAQILCAAARAEKQVWLVGCADGNTYFQCGSEFSETVTSHRRKAQILALMEQLESARLVGGVNHHGANIWIVTHAGYLAADELSASASKTEMAHSGAARFHED